MPATPDITQDDTVATSFLAALETAWNGGDGAAFGAPFAQDATFVDIRGDLHRGRAAIAGGHQGILDSIYKGSTVAYELESSRAVAPGVVVLHTRSTLDAPAGPLAGRHQATGTAVLIADGGEWRAQSFHNTLRAA